MRKRLYLLILLFLSACATSPPIKTEPLLELAYTTDSEISPYDLFKWEAVYVSAQDKDGIFYIVSEHPLLRTPVDCPIKYILCQVIYEKGKLIGYAYYIGPDLEIYELQTMDFTLSSGHFARVEVTEEKRKIIDYFLLRFLDMDRT